MTALPKTEWLGRMDYGVALEMQNSLIADVVSGAGEDRLLLLEHEPVYTIGRTRDQSSLGNPLDLPHPLFETNRGGQATWHGPGQLVGYPIISLRERGRDLHAYLRFLEEVVIETCAACGVNSSRRDGLTGVWVKDRKIASIGVGVRHWVTMHGFALNVCGSLEAFHRITPCGIAGVEMTSIELESDEAVSVEAVAELTAGIFLRLLPGLLPDVH